MQTELYCIINIKLLFLINITQLTALIVIILLLKLFSKPMVKGASHKALTS